MMIRFLLTLSAFALMLTSGVMISLLFILQEHLNAVPLYYLLGTNLVLVAVAASSMLAQAASEDKPQND